MKLPSLTSSLSSAHPLSCFRLQSASEASCWPTPRLCLCCSLAGMCFPLLPPRVRSQLKPDILSGTFLGTPSRSQLPTMHLSFPTCTTHVTLHSLGEYWLTFVSPTKILGTQGHTFLISIPAPVPRTEPDT